jgi:hypothetical protein
MKDPARRLPAFARSSRGLRDTKQAINPGHIKRRKAIALANRIAKKAACHIEVAERGLGFTIRDEQEGAALRTDQGNGQQLSFICLYVWLEKYFSRGDYRRGP